MGYRLGAGILGVKVVRKVETAFRTCKMTVLLNTYYVLCTSDTVSHVTLSYEATETQQEKVSHPRSHSCSSWSGTQIQDSQTAKSILLQASQVTQLLRRQDVAATGPGGRGSMYSRRGQRGEAERGREGVGLDPPFFRRAGTAVRRLP